MKTRKGILTAAVVATAAWVGYLAAAPMFSATPVEVAEVRTGPIHQYVAERAKTRLPRTYLITTPAAGRIEPVALAEGDRVEKGKTVARMVPIDLRFDVEEAEAVVHRLEASIAENREKKVEETALDQAWQFVSSMKDTVKAALARVESGEAQLTYAKKHHARTETLAKTAASSQEELDRAMLQLVQSDVDSRQDKLVHSAMIAMEKATNLLPRMIQQNIDMKAMREKVLEKERAEAVTRLERIRENQARGEMKSPVDGVVLNRFVESEQYLPAGTKLLEIGRLEDLEIEADVMSLDVVNVKVGDPVRIVGPAVGPKPAGGRVKNIFPAGFTKVSSLGVEQQRVKVIIDLDKEDLARLLKERHLEVGYRVRVEITTAEKRDALIVPRTALFRGAGSQWQVYVVRDGRASLQAVQVGLLNDRNVEITEGLTAGDQVVVAPENTLSDGLRVAPLP